MRTLLLAMASLLTMTACTTTDSDPDGRQAFDQKAREAFHFAFPAYEVMRTRWEHLQEGGETEDRRANEWLHSSKLADEDSRFVTTPNNDTLYSTAFLDLANGPVLLSMPAPGDRYATVAFLDLFTNNFAVVSADDAAREAAKYLVAGPAWKGEIPQDARLLRAPTNDVWAILRILVDGPPDLQAARSVQAGFELEPLGADGRGTPLRHAVPPMPEGSEFLNVVNESFARGPLPEPVRRQLEGFDEVGLRADSSGSENLPARTVELWERHLPRFYSELNASTAGVPALQGGWAYLRPTVGSADATNSYRSVIALAGLGALPLTEAFYASGITDASGELLNGNNRYRISIPAGGLPVDSFWSLSMYRVMPDGRLFFAGNPLDRFAIGDRTSGIERAPDGSLKILIQHEQPETISNWLPAPEGAFRLILRGYRPKTEMLAEDYRLPPIERLPAEERQRQ